MTKLWVSGRDSKDRDEWKEDVISHCETYYDDPVETSEMQNERIRYQRCRKHSLIALQGRRIQITIDRNLRARREMIKNKADVPDDRCCNVFQWRMCKRSRIDSKSDSRMSTRSQRR